MIDPTKQYVYHNQGGPEHGKAVTQLHRFNCDDSHPWRGVCNGTIFLFTDDDPHLREVDPVLYYLNHHREYTFRYSTFSGALRRRGAGVISCSATHASGKVRQIPLDATTDPEGGVS